MKKKLFALALAAAMVLALFAGCGTSKKTDDVSPSPDETVEPSPDTTPDDLAQAPEIDYDAAYAAYAPDTVVMTINGIDVTWDAYFYWLYNIVSQIEYSYGTVDFDMELDAEHTAGAYAKEYAESMVNQYWIIKHYAKENGVELSEEDNETLKALNEQDAQNYAGGDMDAFIDYLKTLYITEEVYNDMNTASVLYSSLFEHFYGNLGEKLSDEAAMTYAEESGYMHAKHILFFTIDQATYQPLSDEEIEAQTKAANDCLAELEACTDLESLKTLFDEKMNTLSEDGGLISNPDGYYFVDGDMEENFEAATKALEINEMSGLVESFFGYHIILRLPIELDAALDTSGSTLRYLAAGNEFDTMFGEWFDSSEIVYSDGFEELELKDVFKEKA